MTVSIIQGDCRDVMRTEIPAGSIDAVITDPPYGISYRSNHGGGRFAKIANDERPFVWWLPEAFSVLKDGGALVCFCRWDVQEAFRLAIEWAGFTVKSQLVWDRGWHGMGDLKGNFAPCHDVAWFATKGRFSFPGKRPASVLRHRRLAANELTHPTEKPAPLMRELIEALVPQGGIVLDPFAGSGSTLEAARAAGRDAIGIELAPEYVAATQARIERAAA
jgi:DNA modification methylase